MLTTIHFARGCSASISAASSPALCMCARCPCTLEQPGVTVCCCAQYQPSVLHHGSGGNFQLHATHNTSTREGLEEQIAQYADALGRAKAACEAVGCRCEVLCGCQIVLVTVSINNFAVSSRPTRIALQSMSPHQPL